MLKMQQPSFETNLRNKLPLTVMIIRNTQQTNQKWRKEPIN